jgi:hypothetical protein
MANKDIIIGRVINITGMIQEPSYSLSRLYCSYFDVASALIFLTRFTGFGRSIEILREC